MNINQLILTRKDLKPQRYHTQIQHIDTLCFSELSFSRRLILTADYIVFVDDNWSYKVLKDRSGENGRIVEWVDILCLQCDKVFNAFNEKDIACCPRCNCVSNLFNRSGNFSWVGWCIK
jgi:uncharacterized paraquat-inducible protein A